MSPVTPAWSLVDKTHLVPCPLCDGRQFRVLIESDRYDMDLQTVGCLGCGLAMSNPQPTPDALNEFYTHHYRHYYQKVEEPSEAYIREYRKDERAAETASYLRSQGVLPKDGSVLDIGASEGCILKALRDLEPGLHLVAVEPNPTFGAFAVTHAGCTLHPSLEPVKAAGSRFDLIILNHVFEHLASPVDYLQELSQLLTSRGCIYIDVPDLAYYTGLESLHLAHLYHFSQRTLSAVARRAGCQVQALEAHAPVMHPKSIRTLLKAGGKPAATPPSFLPEGWDLLLRINRKAGRYHRRRWSLSRRIKFWLTTRLSRGPRVVAC